MPLNFAPPFRWFLLDAIAVSYCMYVCTWLLLTIRLDTATSSGKNKTGWTEVTNRTYATSGWHLQQSSRSKQLQRSAWKWKFEATLEHISTMTLSIYTTPTNSDSCCPSSPYIVHMFGFFQHSYYTQYVYKGNVYMCIYIHNIYCHID